MTDRMPLMSLLPRSRLEATRCVHRWVIETPNGATSLGVCRYCGARRQFSNAWEGWHLRDALELDFMEPLAGWRGLPTDGKAA